MKSRRLGTFSISLDLIEDHPEEVRNLMGQCVILRAEVMYHKHAVDYVAISEQFPEIAPGEMPTPIDWFRTKDGPWVAEYEPRKRAA